MMARGIVYFISFRYLVMQYRVWPLYSTLDQPTSRLMPVRFTVSSLVMVAATWQAGLSTEGMVRRFTFSLGAT